MSIYAIWGPPNSGKTTLAVDLAHAFSAQDQSTCLISPESYSELSSLLGIQIMQGKSLAAVQSDRDSIKQLVHTADELLYVLAAPTDADAFGEGLSSETAKALIEQAGAVFDAVLVDCTSACNSVLAAWAIRKADRVILTSGAAPSAALWYRAHEKALVTVRKAILPVCMECSRDFDYQSLARLTGYAPQVWLPFVPDAQSRIEKSHALYGTNGKPGRKYTAAIDELGMLLEGGTAK